MLIPTLVSVSVETDEGAFVIRKRASEIEDRLKGSKGKTLPDDLARLVRSSGVERFVPVKAVRPPLGETSKCAFLESYWKDVPFDLVVFDDRWVVSLSEKKFGSGSSRVYITSVLKVTDLKSGKAFVKEKSITPNDNGPNDFDSHLGTKVVAMEIVNSAIVIQTDYKKVEIASAISKADMTLLAST